MASHNETKLTIPAAANPSAALTLDRPTMEDAADDMSQRAQWLRAAVLGANDGLVSTASLMMGVGAVKADARAMVLSGFAGLIAGACSMAIGEFVSVHSQLDVELAEIKRSGADKEAAGLPRPMQAAMASALAFATGAMVPLLAAGFIRGYRVRLGVVAAAASVALVVFGCAGAALGRAPLGRAGARVLVGGWVAMGLTFGLMKLFGSAGL
ncbi:Vacuolar iron transporter [Ananas comosus]|uniref:Vacuolar iron transporter n=2 Tax=Ananas comosus TaxID=4615 RepID=A0A199VAI8_ANACO|nr:Vacuolar iron transporter [Ananas comosus]